MKVHMTRLSKELNRLVSWINNQSLYISYPQSGRNMTSKLKHISIKFSRTRAKMNISWLTLALISIWTIDICQIPRIWCCRCRWNGGSSSQCSIWMSRLATKTRTYPFGIKPSYWSHSRNVGRSLMFHRKLARDHLTTARTWTHPFKISCLKW